MSQHVPGPDFNVRGAVDLSSFGRPTVPPPGAPGGAPAAAGFVIDVTAELFSQVVEQSKQLPVIVLLWIPTDKAIAEYAGRLGAIVNSYDGQFLLARVDVSVSPEIAQAFQVQDVPATIAVVGGQPVPLFPGIVTDAEIRPMLDELLKAAGQQGITGRIGSGEPGEDQGHGTGAEPIEPELPPLHQAAYEAIEANDYAAAITFYTKALTEDPRDAQAAAGLANVKLLSRVVAMDLAEVRARAANDPADLNAQLDVADLDLSGGKVEDALGRLIELVPGSDGAEREALRVRLVEYFEILGSDDPRVGPARRALANALY